VAEPSASLAVSRLDLTLSPSFTYIFSVVPSCVESTLVSIFMASGIAAGTFLNFFISALP